MRHLANGLAGAASLFALSIAAAPAHAQNVSNEVWLGQNGVTNVVDIDQAGRGNSAGADNVSLRLNQFGETNILSIDQFGWDNKVGTLSFESGPVGVNQTGDRNEIEITQQNFTNGGSNVVGAVEQISPQGGDISTLANSLTVIQDGTGAAQHRVGQVRQVSIVDGGATNAARIEQYGGGFDAGNRLASLSQSGSGNTFDLLQSGQSNRVGVAVQQGMSNDADLTQREGDENLVEFSEQYGANNDIDVEVTGSRNVMVRLYQDNTGWEGAAVGNRIAVTIKGDDNGANGIDGGAGEFVSQSAIDIGIAQGEFYQIGDDNDIGLTVNEGNANRFGVRQEGDDNEATIGIASLSGRSSDDNEVAVRQLGDSNVAIVEVLGQGNAAGIILDGDKNQIFVDQDGSGNTISARIVGDSNNAVGAVFEGKAALVAIEALNGPLLPGTLIQAGIGNRAGLEITGSQNNVAAEQTGNGHLIEARMINARNGLVVVQGGNQNTSISFQAGTANTLGVRQF